MDLGDYTRIRDDADDGMRGHVVWRLNLGLSNTDLRKYKSICILDTTWPCIMTQHILIPLG